MALWQWSITAANNATADPSINWQEGQAPSTVNDSARAMMAAIATWYQAPEWLNLGDTPTYVSGTQFTVPTNRTSAYTVGRRVRAFVAAGTIYGSISASAYTSLTTVTVTWDAGSLDSGVSEVDVGILNPSNPSYPFAALAPQVTLGSSAFNGQTQINLVNHNYSATLLLHTTDGLFGLFDNTGAFTRFYSDASGNFNAAGNINAGGTISGTNITGTSDRRLKSRIKRIRNATEIVLAWVGVTFQRKGDKAKRRHAGFVADDMVRSTPELVFEDDKGFKSIAYGNTSAYLAVAFQELEARVRKLESNK
ncbi:tail fiber domain-containing protein [Burkholderia ubonensis]|uniref:tail fiber domain-containing protein n=1 Tax=Burkholderia ubonensis TaxID=101571 RepID=UPI000AA1E130|nr:tail fiber domain-containing protein [Burkholderia ubonensis]